MVCNATIIGERSPCFASALSIEQLRLLLSQNPLNVDGKIELQNLWINQVGFHCCVDCNCVELQMNNNLVTVKDSCFENGWLRSIDQDV